MTNHHLRWIPLTLTLVGMACGPAYLLRAEAQVRSKTDRLDDSTNPYQLHLLYVVASDRQDYQLDTNGTIAGSAKRALGWLNSEGGRTIRLDTFQGDPDITFVRLNRTDREIREHDDPVAFVEWQLIVRGLLKPEKIYGAYFEGHYAPCAAASQPPSSLGQVALLAIGDPSCGIPISVSTGVDHWEYSLIHEAFHLLGAVSPGSPHAADKGHLVDNTGKDLMSSGSWDPPGLLLDRGHDDYWGHAQSGYEDLSLSVFMEPTIGLGYLPPAWPLQRLAALSSPPQPNPTPETEAQIGFVNMWDEEIVLYLREASGGLVFEASLEKDQAHWPGRLIGDVWVVTRSRDLVPLAAWVAPAGLSLAIFQSP